MKMLLKRKFGKKEEDKKVEHDDWEDDRSDQVINVDDELIGKENKKEEEGDKNMAKFKEVQEKSEEEMAEDARLKMGGFNSLSNLNKKETEDRDIQDEKSEVQLKKESSKLKRDVRKKLKQMNSLEEWSFENTVEICRNNESCKFQTIANAQFLGNLLDRKVVMYFGDLQRGWKSNSKNELVEVKSEKQIKLILDSLLHDRMHGGFITLNLNPNDSHEINFNEDDGIISGSINQKLQILDGNHRLNAFSRWVKLYMRNPESVPNPADYYISVVIETLDDDSSKSLFSEYATKSLKISKSRGEYLNVEDNTNKLCREIMKKSDIEVEVVSTAIKANSKSIITFGVLSKNIKENYDPKTKIEIQGLSDYLTMFIDSLIFTFPKFMASKDLEERTELRKHRLEMEALAWGGYFKLSTRLQGKSREEILDVLSKFNADIEYKGFKGKFLERENPIFRKIMREGFRIINTSSSATWVNKVFIEYALENKTLEEIGKEEIK